MKPTQQPKTSDYLSFVIPDDLFGLRVDKALTKLCQDYSRSTVQGWIKKGLVLLDDEVPRQKDKVLGGETLEVSIPKQQQGDWESQDIDIECIYEDEHMLVINKPAGLVVHPGAGNPDGTLLNALLHHYPDNRAIARAGIVHRLDKDTSGLMVVARTEKARLALIDQLVDHSLYREYAAVCQGRIISGGTVEEPIGRDKQDRRKMCVNMLGKEALTHYRVSDRFRHHTLLSVRLETGRTHQIRVHMTHLGFALVGDPVYGRRLAIPGDCTAQLESALRGFKRQALHAACIEYTHPETNELQRWQAPMPDDLTLLINALSFDNER